MQVNIFILKKFGMPDPQPIVHPKSSKFVTFIQAAGQSNKRPES